MSKKHPKNLGPRCSIYYIQDGSLEAMFKVYELENSLEVPKEGAVAAGLCGCIFSPWSFLLIKCCFFRFLLHGIWGLSICSSDLIPCHWRRRCSSHVGYSQVWLQQYYFFFKKKPLIGISICANSNTFSETLKKKMLEIRDQILGPQNLCLHTKPVNDKGGTTFERDTKPREVQGCCCYAFGMSHEQQTWLSAPCKDGKINEKLLQVSGTLVHIL